MAKDSSVEKLASNKWSGRRETVRNVFWPTETMVKEGDKIPPNLPEIKTILDDLDEESNDMEENKNQPSDRGMAEVPDPKVDAGLRGETWYEWMENQTKQNRKRSLDNKRVLGKIDLRTVWIARLLIGLFITILGGFALEMIML